MFSLCCLGLAFCLFASSQKEMKVNADPKLIQVIGVTRHGVRSSINPIPSLPCPKFKETPGEITQKGHEENYQLGESIRESYKDFIGSEFSIKKHYFISSGEPKTLISGQSIFQGMFNSSFVDGMKPYPSVPIHSETLSSDHVMMFSSTCAEAISAERQYVTKTDEWNEIAKANKEFFGKVKEKGGFSFDITFGTVPKAAEQIILATHNGFTSTSENCVFDDNDMNDKLIELATKRNIMNNNPKDTELAKLQASPFINDVIKNIKARIASKDKEKEFVMYIGSNANVLGPLQLFKQESPGRVPFGSLFYFEVYNTNGAKTEGPYEEADIKVKVGYRKFENGKLEPVGEACKTCNLSPVMCNEQDMCTIQQLKDIVYTNEEWLTKCGLDEKKPEPANNETEIADKPVQSKAFSPAALATTIVLAVVLLIAIVVIVILGIKNCSISSRLKAASANSDGMAIQMKAMEPEAESASN
ncbi:uncharacterized protein MONOS_3577 [Monocercomonoides exilis]|uniref:uncharacterized protein n=1 Tax=Monocercomonoides exilis TaxID=2049356 RepID=UPI00355A7B2F|nr:hypothetical protein MONOS_3577 [Monocercomonoides exilis]|eukprot:MONOS_3577.1-p1 / transcript=MONOS_3577.1 / gene=MONOS_3577 / organism=Monocercomonoides_exilis_PA203 / gene_product=unspecified product / transcript_product=unspecified product / location=Mono_scaffold00085:71426-73385(-) / protein_length=472 / sequence_SO=supercontig / SO=protein_coding / is_pseudo=false